MSVPIIRAFVTPEAKLRLSEDQRRALDEWLKTLAGKSVDLTVQAHREKRSTQANRYYFGVVVKLLSEHCGYDPDEMHEALAMKFLRIEDCPVTGVPRRKRTPGCDTKEFALYVDACIRLAAELGVYIPGPEEVAVA